MKLIAIDLDGTLLNSNHQISNKDICTIKKAQSFGITVVISTGRTFDSAKSILENHNIIVPYIITCNGSIINDFSGNILYSFPVDKSSLEKVVSFLHFNNYYFSLASSDSRLFPKYDKNILMSDFYEAKINNPDLKEEDLDNLINLFYDGKTFDGKVFNNIQDMISTEEDIYGICAVSFSNEKLENGIKAFKDIKNLSIFKSAYNNFELINENSSKGQAVKILCNHLGIDLKDTMAIGDNQNDLSMFEIVQFSVAMENAYDSIKEKCSFVTLNNNSSGVGHAIENILELTV